LVLIRWDTLRSTHPTISPHSAPQFLGPSKKPLTKEVGFVLFAVFLLIETKFKNNLHWKTS
ncbi:hypothetical protein LJC24_05600, partial [Desulfococcaceae bacterium OttesenSCG-928-F15]|nr:hypothetical protein [Desulfococcaceae bacterium OttesenSCG-928-F15]